MALTFAGNASGTAINGGSVTLTLSSTAAVAGNYVLVTVATGTSVSTSVGHAVASSSGLAYTNLMRPTLSSAGTLYMSVWATKLPATPFLNAICSGNGRSTNGTVACAMVLIDDGKNPALDAITSSNGSGTTPDSPSVTVTSSNDVAFSCVASLITDAAITPPTSFLNVTSTAVTETVGTSVGMAMITLASTAAFDPTAWSNFTTAVWLSATVAIKAGSTALRVGYYVDAANLPEKVKYNVVAY